MKPADEMHLSCDDVKKFYINSNKINICVKQINKTNIKAKEWIFLVMLMLCLSDNVMRMHKKIVGKINNNKNYKITKILRLSFKIRTLKIL